MPFRFSLNYRLNACKPLLGKDGQGALEMIPAKSVIAIDSRLVKAPYSRELERARHAEEDINLHAHVGASAWDRARRLTSGNRLVVPLDQDHGPTDYDFAVLDGLSLTLNAIDADLVLARRVAIAMCGSGARLVVLLHPGLAKNSEFFYGTAT